MPFGMCLAPTEPEARRTEGSILVEREKSLRLFLRLLRSARRGSNPRSSPWQGDVVPLYYSRAINVRSTFISVKNENIIQKIMKTSVNVIADIQYLECPEPESNQ